VWGYFSFSFSLALTLNLFAQAEIREQELLRCSRGICS